MDQAEGSAQAAAVTAAESPRSAPEQHWLARLSFLFIGLAVVFIAVFAELKSLAMLAVETGMTLSAEPFCFRFMIDNVGWCLTVAERGKSLVCMTQSA